MPGEPRIVLVFGDDDYAVNQRLAQLTSRIADPTTSEMNTARLDGRSVSQDDLHNAVNSLPFLAERRLVILAHPSARCTTPESKQKFIEFLERTPETTTLVLWEPSESRSWGAPGGSRREDDKHWLAPWLRKHSLAVEHYAQPRPEAMSGWIMKNAQAQGGAFNAAAASRLAEMVGADTRLAAHEVTKLLTYVDWKRAVTAADVEALTPFTAEADIWSMVDAISTGKGSLAMQLLRRYIDHDGDFFAWSMIIRQFRLTLLAREILDRRGSQADAEKALGLKGYPAQKALDHARRFSMQALERIYHRLLEIDEAAKTGRMPLELGMELLVAELTG